MLQPSSRGIPLAIFLTACVLQFVGMHPLVSLYDEGIILVGAERVLQGDLPYRDFWTLYGPGQFYLVSFLYSIFGVSDLTLRVYGILIKAAITSLAYLLIVPFARRSLALTGAVLVLFVLIGMHNYGFPVFPALALAMTSLLLLDRTEGTLATNLGLAGICAGIVTVFRQDLGVYAALAIAACCLLTAPPKNTAAGQHHGGRGAATRLIWFATGYTVIMLPVAVMLVSAVPLRDLQENLFTIPFTVYPAFRSLPFPTELIVPNDIAWFHPRVYAPFSVYVPFIVVIWSAALEFRHRYIGSPDHRNANVMLVPALLLMTLLFTLKGLVRTSPLHSVQSIVLSIVLLAIGVARVDWRHPRERAFFAPGLAVALALVVVVASFGVYAVVLATNALVRQTTNLRTRCFYPELPRLRCASVDAETLAAAQFVRVNSHSSDVIYVGTDRHDKIMINDVAFYFLSERLAATKWQELHPGVQTTDRIQREMVSEMKRTPPAFVILNGRDLEGDEPNASRFSSGVFVLDDYIRSHFVEVQRFGAIRVLSRR